MLWPFGAACTIVAGSLFLIFGTAAQAWFQISDYKDVLEKAKAVTKGRRLTSVLKKTTGLFAVGRWYYWFIPVIGVVFLILRTIGFYSAIALILLNWNKIRKSTDEGHEEAAARLTELLRLAVPWYLLLAGSLFVLVGAVIQLVLAWP